YHPQFIEVEVTNRNQFPMTDMMSLTNATITAELETGETWVLRNAFQANDLELAAAEGSLTLRFEGPDMRRQTG
ncbi:MAG TPA: phage tail tube protein, partial [Steroidobacteraceae bacterium]|nr:phage tail tube protein [Steroidobacteraceae bacterium]